MQLFKKLTATIGVVIWGMSLIPTANAQCGFYNLPGSTWQQGSPKRQVKLRPAPLLLVSNPDSDNMSIVGFWKFEMVAKGNAGIPDGTVIDFGFAQWHSDGTEIINSGARKPASGDFCLGIWKKTGGSTYQLNHFPIVYDEFGDFVGPANLIEKVAVGRGGKTYAGAFTITQYDPTGQNILGSVGGTVTAKRVTVDTAVTDIF